MHWEIRVKVLVPVITAVTRCCEWVFGWFAFASVPLEQLAGSFRCLCMHSTVGESAEGEFMAFTEYCSAGCSSGAIWVLAGDLHGWALVSSPERGMVHLIEFHSKVCSLPVSCAFLWQRPGSYWPEMVVLVVFTRIIGCQLTMIVFSRKTALIKHLWCQHWLGNMQECALDRNDSNVCTPFNDIRTTLVASSSVETVNWLPVSLAVPITMDALTLTTGLASCLLCLNSGVRWPSHGWWSLHAGGGYVNVIE